MGCEINSEIGFPTNARQISSSVNWICVSASIHCSDCYFRIVIWALRGFQDLFSVLGYDKQSLPSQRKPTARKGSPRAHFPGKHRQPTKSTQP